MNLVERKPAAATRPALADADASDGADGGRVAVVVKINNTGLQELPESPPLLVIARKPGRQRIYRAACGVTSSAFATKPAASLHSR